MNWLARRAWLVFFVLGLGAVLAAPMQLLGNPPEPPSAERLTGHSLAEIDGLVPGTRAYVSSMSTQLGNFMLAMGVLLAAVAAGPFRRGEAWAWKTLWIMPILLLIQFRNSKFGRGWQLDLGLVPITIAALVASRRRILAS